jgi:PadR family transcriptional regulator PadR
MAAEEPRLELLQGTLDLLILTTLRKEPLHGFGIASRLEELSDATVRVEQGSLYPALYRLEEQGWIKAEWGVSETNRKAKFYSLTAPGRKRLAVETDQWRRMSGAINLILQSS